MTLKTSFFNKGIYKSTVKRYIWGSVAYFLILFFSSSLLILLDYGFNLSEDRMLYYSENPLLLETTYMFLPMLISIVAPSIVSILVFRFLHSKNQSVFIHSLPVSRRANYISTIAAAFTLMGAPVILNGLILLAMSLGNYGVYFSPRSCAVWTGCNLLGIYMMFSCAVFSANLTGNSFASIAINIIIHSFLFITVSVFYIMAELFLHGFAQPDTLLEILSENNFAYVSLSLSDNYFRDYIDIKNLLIYLCAPALIDIASYFLYKKRKIETASDVAAFSPLNKIFKYGVCFLATMFAFAVFSYEIAENPLIIGMCIFLISILTYFACEMLLKKTMKVFYSWKGYIGFAIVFGIIILLFSGTSFFGYETRVPNKESVAEVAVYSYYNTEEKPFCSNEKAIELAIEAHHKFSQEHSVFKTEPLYRDYGTAITVIHVDYKLKNGKTMLRKYNISTRDFENLMDELYTIEDFKKCNELIFMDDKYITQIRTIDDGVVYNKKEMLEAIRSDYLALSYRDIHFAEYDKPMAKTTLVRDVWVDYLTTDYSGNETWTNSFHVSVNSKYTNTLEMINNK